MNTSSQFALYACVLVLTALAAKAEDLPPSPQVTQKADEIRVFRYPNKAFVDFDPAKPDAPPKPREHVRALSPQAGERAATRYDVGEFFAAAGLKIPEATYFLEAGVLVMRAPKDSWDDYDAAVTTDFVLGGQDDSLRLTFTLVEFRAAGEGSDLGKLGYRELRQKAGTTWRELRNLTFNARSGRRASAAHTATIGGKAVVLPSLPPGKEDEELPPIEELGPDEYGIKCLVETQIGPDGRTCDMGCSLRWRAGRGEPASRLQSHIQLLEDHPVVLQIDTTPSTSAPRQPPRHQAMVVAVHVMKLGDWREGHPLVAKPAGKPKK